MYRQQRLEEKKETQSLLQESCFLIISSNVFEAESSTLDQKQT